MSSPLRFLIVDDSENDAILLVRELKRNYHDLFYERVDTAAAMSEALDKQVWDVVISDFVMPQFDGLQALKVLQEKGLDLPFIIVSGKISEETAVLAMKAGAHDYIMKSNLKRLNPAVKRELQEAETRRERRKAEDMLANYEKDLRTLASEVSLAEERERRRIAVELHDRVGQCLAFCILRVESLKKSLSFNQEEIDEVYKLLRELLNETRSLTFELSLTSAVPDTKLIFVEAKVGATIGRFSYTAADVN